PHELLAHIATAHAIIIDEDVKITQSILDAAPNLKIVGRATSSLIGIDINAATERGIIVMNTPGVDSITVAEYTITMLLALARNLVPAHNSLLTQTPNYQQLRGIQLQGKTLGIVGFGRVGRE